VSERSERARQAQREADPHHWCWRRAPRPGGPAVVLDLDGVLADARGRPHFLNGPGRKDWRSFFDAAGDDPVIEEVARLLELLDRDLSIVLLTARPMRIRPLTEDWLVRNDVDWDLLVMRPDRDFGPSVDFKRRTARHLKEVGFDLRLAFEDDRRNVDMFHEEGVPCVYLHSGYYEDYEEPQGRAGTLNTS
jgi:hypothetical protein